MRKLRSKEELSFRLRQESSNLWMYLRPPNLAGAESKRQRKGVLPDPAAIVERLKDTSFAAEVVAIGEQALRRELPVFGSVVHTGSEIRWRRDYATGIENGTEFFRRIPYLDAARVGDHKQIWEINRHQHLVAMAQASLFSGRVDFIADMELQLESWREENPFHRGINWCSALEVAFRALSWIWVDHFVGERMSTRARGELRQSIYQAACHLEPNLSLYFSRNTHLLGEAVALHAIGVLYPEFPNSDRRRSRGEETVRREIAFQFHDDGSHFEQSSYYHVYATDLVALFYVLAGRPADLNPSLASMAGYLDALLGPNRLDPLIGDDDGGRLFHPYGERRAFGRATLATLASLLDQNDWQYELPDLWPQAAWWVGAGVLDRVPPPPAEKTSKLYHGAGLAVLRGGDADALVDAGGFGPGRGGHSHSDSLSIVLRTRSADLLTDSGTFTYAGDSDWRNRFRGSAAHNTIRIQKGSQAVPSYMFGWDSPPRVRILEWSASAEADDLDAECCYAGYRHRRRIRRVAPFRLFVLDEVHGEQPDEMLFVEQFWHAGVPVKQTGPGCFSPGGSTVLSLSVAAATLEEGGEFGWRSVVYGRREPSACIRAVMEGRSPLYAAAVIDCGSPAPVPVPVRLTSETDGSHTMHWNGGAVCFTPSGILKRRA